MPAPASNRKGLSLHVGLNEVDAVHYGSKNELSGCVNDANAMEALAKQQGFEVLNVLIDSQGTRAAVSASIIDAANRLNSGDIFLFTYSGHGASLRDLNADEKIGKPADIMDEAWCLYDGMFLDDEAAVLWRKFKPGVRVFVLLDCCHSGSAIRGGNVPVYPGPLRKNRGLTAAETNRARLNNADFYRNIEAKTAPSATLGEEGAIKCAVRLISGCQDDEKSLDGDVNGLFTENLLLAWSDGAFEGGYEEFHAKIKDNIGGYQNPNFYFEGIASIDFDKQKPFTI
jgi:metacaspase-1